MEGRGSVRPGNLVGAMAVGLVVRLILAMVYSTVVAAVFGVAQDAGALDAVADVTTWVAVVANPLLVAAPAGALAAVCYRYRAGTPRWVWALVGGGSALVGVVVDRVFAAAVLPAVERTTLESVLSAVVAVLGVAAAAGAALLAGRAKDRRAAVPEPAAG